MLTLATSKAAFTGFDQAGSSLLKISTDRTLPPALRADRGFVVRDADVPGGFRAYIVVGGSNAESLSPEAASIALPAEFAYLADGDVLRISPSKTSVRVLYRRASKQNFALVTERCNNYCLMCSQPPKPADDSWIADEILDLLPLMDRGMREITFTGGEPTLLGSRFIDILKACRSWLPETAVHVLSNGRTFADTAFAESYASVRHHDIMVGIPLYSDISERHDYVVQADGAFDETVRGILNLKRLRQRVEIRVVLHRQTVDRLPELATFIARNLRFVDQVALMGLEMTGFTKANLEALWIDPFDYQQQLREAIEILETARILTKVYNHQLCVLDRRLWPYARKSISDWKNEYLPACFGCSEQANCGGFFASAKLRFSDHIRAIEPAETLS